MTSSPTALLSAKKADVAVPVSPIRSMSIRTPLRRTSFATLRNLDLGTPSPQKLPIPSRGSLTNPSETIKAAIERLGRLSDHGQQAAKKAPRAQPQSEAQVEKIEKGNSRIQTATSVSMRVARYMDKIQAQNTESSEAQGITGPKRVVLRDLIPYRKHLHGGQSLKACSPAHNVVKLTKSPPAEAVVSFDYSIADNQNMFDGIRVVTQGVTANQTSAHRANEAEDFNSPSTSSHHVESLEPVSAKDHVFADSLPVEAGQDSDSKRTTTERSQTVHFQDVPINAFIGRPPALKLNGKDFIPEDKDSGNESFGTQAPRSQASDCLPNPEVNIPGRPAESVRSSNFKYTQSINLKGLGFVDVPGQIDDYDNHENCHHGPVAREWSTIRKRFTASVACLNASCIGLLLGIYTGEVPALQYVIIDVNHHIILGNVVLYLGIAISNFLFWPLPLLHGRKPYTVAGYIFGLCFQIPQGIAAGSIRLPDDPTWIVVLLVSRAFSGLALGLCDINVHATLLDLFGASLQSRHPHQEIPDPFDIRRQGGGLGLWLGIWSCCLIGPISVGFMVGAVIIDHVPVAWGFWLSLIVLTLALLLNVVAPEVRRAAFRRTLTEIRNENGTISRVARGEVKMHLFSTGPAWWGDEVKAGLQLSGMMARQPGFLILSLYSAWVFAQFTLILVLLGALASVGYYRRPVHVGLCVLSLAIGAFFATPFQKASWLSRSRKRSPTTASMTLLQQPTWSSHLVRRTAFTLLLPICAAVYAATSTGPPFPIAVPSVMAAFIGFFTAMALAECSGLIFENFDTSDLQPGLNRAQRRQSVISQCGDNKINFSSYPRIGAGVAVVQSIKYCFAAAATGIGGRVERRLGAVQTAAAVAGILLGMTILLTASLIRWKTIQLVADERRLQSNSLDRQSIQGSMMVGRFSNSGRKISILEAGTMTRWSEIRDRSRLGIASTTG